MANENAKILDHLDELLIEERRAVLAGDFGALAEIADRKVSLIERVKGLDDRTSKTRLIAIGARAEEIGRLLAAALEGVKSANARLALIRNAGERLDTYDSEGRGLSVPFGAATIERRV